MKNDSSFFPYSMPGDGWFDHNGDGRLSGLETMERDAYHLHMIDMAARSEEQPPAVTPRAKAQPGAVNGEVGAPFLRGAAVFEVFFGMILLAAAGGTAGVVLFVLSLLCAALFFWVSTF